MNIQGIGQERAPCRTLSDINPVLFRLFLSDGIPQHAESYQHYPGSGIGDTDGMRTHQCMVEDLHPHGSHRRSGRRTGSLFDCLFLQSYLVAGIRHPAGWHGGYSPHDSPSAYVGAGGNRIPRWSSVRSLYYISKVSIH